MCLLIHLKITKINSVHVNIKTFIRTKQNYAFHNKNIDKHDIILHFCKSLYWFNRRQLNISLAFSQVASGKPHWILK